LEIIKEKTNSNEDQSILSAGSIKTFSDSAESLEKINEEDTESMNPWSDSDGEQEDTGFDSHEVKQLIQDNNSIDGCARYHDIHVRAISNKPDQKLFIFMKNYSYDSFKPMFQIYRKTQPNSNNYKLV